MKPAIPRLPVYRKERLNAACRSAVYSVPVAAPRGQADLQLFHPIHFHLKPGLQHQLLLNCIAAIASSPQRHRRHRLLSTTSSPARALLRRHLFLEKPVWTQTSWGIPLEPPCNALLRSGPHLEACKLMWSPTSAVISTMGTLARQRADSALLLLNPIDVFIVDLGTRQASQWDQSCQRTAGGSHF